MFIKNKYTNWYFSFLTKIKNRDISHISYEKHHIIPTSLGGPDEPDNIARLSPREHFVMHRLLTRMTEGVDKHKMTYALHTFFHFNHHRKLNFTSRQYEHHRILLKEAAKHRDFEYIKRKDVFTFKHEKTGEVFSGTICEFKEYSGLSSQDINWLVTACINPDDPKKTIKKWGVWIESLEIFSFEKFRPPSTIQKLPLITCPHCKKTVSNGNFHRWHGDRCRLVDKEGHYERTRQIAAIHPH